MRLKKCGCGNECSSDNVIFLDIQKESFAGLIMFNCTKCHSTLAIGEKHENYFQVLDKLVFQVLEKKKWAL